MDYGTQAEVPQETFQVGQVTLQKEVSMTFVYVLVSNEKDSYYEQTMISAESLKNHNDNARIVIIVDQDTAKTLCGKRVYHQRLGLEICTVQVPNDMNNRDRSRYLKTSMYNYIDEDFLFIDGDTLICDNLGDIDQSKAIGMVLDRHLLISESSYQSFYDERSKPLKWSSGFEDKHFNSGVIWVKKCPETKKFFDLWHNLWKETLKSFAVVYDQTALNEANAQMHGFIQEIDGTWNCQVSRRSAALKFLYNAKILHYYASFGLTCYDLANKDIQRSVLEETHHELDRILQNPKSAFSDVQDMIADAPSVNIQRTGCYRFLFQMFKRYPRIFRLANKASGFTLKHIIKEK